MFGETVKELRSRRRIPMRGFQHVDIPSSYINSVEKEGLLPGPEKLQQLASVFVDVAKQQKAADPEEDLWLLERELELTTLERSLIDASRIFGEHGREELAQRLRETVEALDAMGIYERAEFMENQLSGLFDAVQEATLEGSELARETGIERRPLAAQNT